MSGKLSSSTLGSDQEGIGAVPVFCSILDGRSSCDSSRRSLRLEELRQDWGRWIAQAEQRTVKSS